MTEFISVAMDSEEVKRAFAKLESVANDGVLRPIVSAVAKLIAAAERAEAPKDSGLMRQAIGTSPTRSYSRGGASRLFVATGVRRGYRRTVTPKRGGGARYRTKRYTEANPTEVVRNPAKYLHLVTRGRKAVAVRSARSLYSAGNNRFFGKRAAAAGPNPFIQRAYDSSAGAAINMAQSIGGSLIDAAIKQVNVSQ